MRHCDRAVRVCISVVPLAGPEVCVRRGASRLDQSYRRRAPVRATERTGLVMTLSQGTVSDHDTARELVISLLDGDAGLLYKASGCICSRWVLQS